MLDPGKRYCLVRPRGGLNDNLTQIAACWQYSEAYNRILIIDTSRSPGFWLPFSAAFKVKNSRVPSLVYDDKYFPDAALAGCQVFPKELKGRIKTYSATYDQNIHNYVDSDSRVRISFDFRTDYPETVLVHEQCGGGLLSVQCLARLTLSELAHEYVFPRVSPYFSGDHLGIHVRHSDYKTDYKVFFESIAPEIRKSAVIVVSTDSAEVVKYARDQFGERKISQVSQTPDTAGQPLHYYAEGLPIQHRFELFCNQLSDLLVLGHAKRLFGARLQQGGLGGYSGFYLLAKALSQNRWIINNLLGLSHAPASTPVE